MIVEKSIRQINLTQLFLRLEIADSHEKDMIIAEIDRRNLTVEQLAKAKKEYEYFKKMKEEAENKPLPWYLKVACLIIPFAMLGGNDNNVSERDLEMSRTSIHKRQRKEVFEYSIAGVVLYFLALIVYLLTIAIKTLLKA